MMKVNTIYGEIDANIMTKLAKVKLLACDVDGVFSDGNIYLGNNGEELKAFNTKDGYGVKAIEECGVQVAIITGRQSTIVEQRMKSLNVSYVLQGIDDKKEAISALCKEHGFSRLNVASMGDDMPDLGMFELSVLGIATADAHPMVRKRSHLVTTLPGGRGAVREICDLILTAKGVINNQFGASV